jgi:hypothetical protein
MRERAFTCGRVFAKTPTEAKAKVYEQVRANGFTPLDCFGVYETGVCGWYEYYIEIEDM